MWRCAVAALLLALGGAAQAGSTGASSGLCEKGLELSTAQKDHRLRLAAVIREQLEAAGRGAVLIARSGVDLQRFGQRYSHMGVSLRDSPNTPWSVRQLYYACDEARPRLFDQGLAGFVLAPDDAPGVHVTLLWLPDEPTQALQRTALDKATALALLSPRYSANAYAFDTRYQNCNQWVVELLAAAWGPRDLIATRSAAQAWLQAEGYAPHDFHAPAWMTLLARFVPLLHDDDHPAAERDAGVFRVSMPASIEAFVQRRLPTVQRLELCHDATRIVLRRGGRPLSASCEPEPGDEVRPFDRDGVAPAGFVHGADTEQAAASH